MPSCQEIELDQITGLIEYNNLFVLGIGGAWSSPSAFIRRVLGEIIVDDPSFTSCYYTELEDFEYPLRIPPELQVVGVPTILLINLGVVVARWAGPWGTPALQAAVNDALKGIDQLGGHE